MLVHADFQLLESGGKKLYEQVILKAQQWATPDELMFVVGATQTEKIAGIRALAPDNFFLVPGIGAQGGDLGLVSKYGMNKQCGLLVNAARSIIYAGSGTDFAKLAAAEAERTRNEMASLLSSSRFDFLV